MSSDSNFEREDLLASLPDLSDEPLDAPWLRRGSPASDSTALVDRAVPRTTPAIPVVEEVTEDAPTPGAKKRRRRWPRVLGVLVLLLALGVVGTGFYVKRQFDGIERVAVSPWLAAPSSVGTNYLIVGTDSRENLDPNIENAAAIFGDGSVDFGGQRTDTIQILRINSDGSQHVLALPRDLYVPIGGGERNRINAAFAFGGAELLIRTIEDSLGIPIHHYAEVDMAGFIELVDSVGGVTIHFPYPAYDLKTGLNVPSGPVELDSAQALAYVRSRTYTEVIDGQTVVDPRGDLGRVKRQQAFLQALAAELESPRSWLSLLTNLEAPLGSLRIDDSMSFTEAASLANQLRGLKLNDEWDLAVSYYTTPEGMQVLAFDSEASQPTLDFFSR